MEACTEARENSGFVDEGSDEDEEGDGGEVEEEGGVLEEEEGEESGDLGWEKTFLSGSGKMEGSETVGQGLALGCFGSLEEVGVGEEGSDDVSRRSFSVEAARRCSSEATRDWMCSSRSVARVESVCGLGCG